MVILKKNCESCVLFILEITLTNKEKKLDIDQWHLKVQIKKNNFNCDI